MFQTEGESSFSEAISAATSVTEGSDECLRDSADGANAGSVYDHVGIVVVEKGKVYVLEATPRAGVVLTPWDGFVAAAPFIDGSPGITVMRLNVDFPVEEAIERAKSHLGEPYDWHFLSNNGKMYCSELVYDSYLYADGSHIFTASPMNFRDGEGNMPEFWTELFSSFGEPVPEGIPGTNPNGLSHDPLLTEVHRFF